MPLSTLERRVLVSLPDLDPDQVGEVLGVGAQSVVELTPTADPAVRDCSSCGRQVFWATDEPEALVHARQGRCIALFRSGVESEIGMLRVPGEDGKEASQGSI